MPSEPILILTTCPDEQTASRIARDLVESGLAACVNRVSSARSTYRWQERIEDEPEVLLIIKTLRQRYPDLELRLRSLHPYEVPEIIAVPILTGSAAYLSWLAAEVADGPAPHGSGPAGSAKGTETA
jgi:periplasmic divalent cation tolerance protein